MFELTYYWLFVRTANKNTKYDINTIKFKCYEKRNQNFESSGQ